MLIDISEHHTEPLPLVPNGDFHAYPVRYRLTWIDVARASGVRALDGMVHRSRAAQAACACRPGSARVVSADGRTIYRANRHPPDGRATAPTTKKKEQVKCVVWR